jgi:SAM-dependent methyltransferase
VDVGSCLDFGCGHGRVLRVLRRRMPGANITACDLDAEAVSFCAEEFGATPLVSQPNIHNVALGTYDVIWMGSVLTHLDESTGCEILGVLSRHLRSDGVLAFSNHGQGLIDARPDVQSALACRGFAYLPYRHYRSEDYGLSWQTPEFVRSTIEKFKNPALEVVVHEPSGWLGGHDLWCIAVRPTPEPTSI